MYKQTSVVRINSLQLELGIQQREQMENTALKSQLLLLDLSSFLTPSHAEQITHYTASTQYQRKFLVLSLSFTPHFTTVYTHMLFTHLQTSSSGLNFQRESAKMCRDGGSSVVRQFLFTFEILRIEL